ncbi:MAG: hypothetical protein HY556_10815 [Euryarchaeota archaeon]|nr:hypothetical protein [Euryarchaeota archaeon]
MPEDQKTRVRYGRGCPCSFAFAMALGWQMWLSCRYFLPHLQHMFLAGIRSSPGFVTRQNLFITLFVGEEVSFLLWETGNGFTARPVHF